MTGTLIDLLVLLGVVAIVVVAAWYVMSQMALPEPIRRIVMIALVIIIAIVAIIALLRLTGHRIGSNDAPFRIAGEPGGALAAVSSAAAADLYR